MQVSTYLDDETNARLSSVARERGESRNMLMLRAVREWLSRQDKGVDLDQDDGTMTASLHARRQVPTWQDSAILT